MLWFPPPPSSRLGSPAHLSTIDSSTLLAFTPASHQLISSSALQRINPGSPVAHRLIVVKPTVVATALASAHLVFEVFLHTVGATHDNMHLKKCHLLQKLDESMNIKPKR